MMSIGNIQLTLREEVLEQFNLLLIGDRIQAVFFIRLVGDLYLGVSSIEVEQSAYPALRIIKQTHNRTEVCSTCS